MMNYVITFALALLPFQLGAETVVARSTLQAKAIVTPDNVRLDQMHTPGAATALDQVLGQELRRAVFAGRPILLSNISKAALIERNQIVQVIFSQGRLRIQTEARALERGAPGDLIQATNIASRKTIQAKVTHDGKLRVLP